MFAPNQPRLLRAAFAAALATALAAAAACSDFLATPSGRPEPLSVAYSIAGGKTTAAADSAAGFGSVDQLRVRLLRGGVPVIDSAFALAAADTAVRFALRVEMEEPEEEVELHLSLLWQGSARFTGDATVRLVRGARNVAVVLMQPVVRTGALRTEVVNAVTGLPLAGATVAVRAGAGAPATGPVAATAVTPATGEVRFAALPAGPYTLFVSAPSMITVVVPSVVVTANGEAVQHVALSPVLAAGETRIVLTWGETPSDLDSHLTGPNGAGGTFHVYYDDRRSRADPTSATADVELDTDDTSGYGPETITIRRQFTGTYCYSVHNYDATPELGTSAAQVRVYRGSQQVATYTVPATTALVWTVFRLDGSTVTPVNTTGDTAPGTCPAPRDP